MKDLKEFTMVNNTSKQGKDIIQNISPRYYDLWKCYNSFSFAKQKAYDYCKELQAKYNGFNGGISGYCITNFSYTFEFELEGKKYKAWITKCNNYLVEL